jgi:hypothetical protein
MPTLTLTHEAPLELIRQYPALAAELVAAMTDVSVPADPSSVRLGPTDMNNVIPVQFTADSVIVVSDARTGAPALIVIVEPQGRDDKTKKYAWPAYITNARRAAQCERAVLLVVCPDAAEAEKCRKVIRTGHPEFDLRPVVIDPLHVPGLDNASPYLVIFATCVRVLDMETETGARRVLAAIRDTHASDAERKQLTTIILKSASDAARQILRNMMTMTEWKDDFIESYVNVGLEKGLEQGLEKGLEQGLEQAKSEYVLKALDKRGLELTMEQREQVSACTDLAQLDRWFDRALTAATTADVFKD